MGVSLTGSALGQSAGSRDGTTTINSANTPVVEPKQHIVGAVGTTPTNKADVPTRKPFQMMVQVPVPRGVSGATQFFPIPAGKRLVIENVSAAGLCPDGLRMELRYATAVDDGNGQGDSGDISFHRIVLTDQGNFGTGSSPLLTANHKVLVFADELIGETHFKIKVDAFLNGLASQVAWGIITFSGYMEDLPVTP